MILDSIVKKDQINEGWSKDSKYKITTDNHDSYLLRYSSLELYEKRFKQFSYMQKVKALNIKMCEPVEINKTTTHTYMIQSWIEGTDLSQKLLEYSKIQQYQYGYEAGETLKKIHKISIKEQEKFEWAKYFNAKIDSKIKSYRDAKRYYEHGEEFISFINDHRYLLNDRPIVYLHGDYHIGNMIIDNDENLVIIDFDRSDFGDPYEEFNRIVWCKDVSYAFATGIIDGYFKKQVPHAFWLLLKLYIVVNSIGSLPWAIAYGEDDVAVMFKQSNKIYEDYDHMQRLIPLWYQTDLKD